MIDRKRRASWKPVSEAEMRAHAQAGGSWAEFARLRRIPHDAVLKAASVLGITSRAEPARVRASLLAAMADRELHTVDMLRRTSGGCASQVRDAVRVLRQEGWILSTVRRASAEDPRRPWARYVITPAGLAELAKMQRGMQ